VRDLAGGHTTPTFAAATPVASYDDAVSLQAIGTRALQDRDRFTRKQEAELMASKQAAGPAAFGPDDIPPVLAGAVTAVDIFRTGACDDFLAPAA
jgi:hypothetical protein